ncbi:DUF4861 domain-containing protein [Flavobacterium gilvum]|uniref:DUF4861 domain-containing protein n=1 Tax=Flavobacterium gilvum TaxID=1492737 RepID=A0AAC9I7P1_9FLAO|nr:DUF4861 domain-containing protein [Flavobacterium gilvum]AOW10836.1 DUF4861 domain-containing protein [Flavobacterium gilvum]KFC59929.1 hypothetical protein FEM08_13060 [Flavobacterium gilvum]
MKSNFKLFVPIALAVLSIMSCRAQQNGVISTVTLSNDSDMKLTDKAVTIKRSVIDKKGIAKDFPLLSYKNEPIPSQVNDLDGDGKWDELFLVTDFSAKEKKIVQLKWVKDVPKFPVRTSVRFGKRAGKDEPVKPATEEVLPANEVYKALGYQRYQTDGPTWENDKVGFRHYLDGRNAKDVFGKKLPAITPENVGINDKGAVEDNYHQMYDWGRDVFPVGSSVGLGGYALLINNEIKRLGILGTDSVNNVEKTTFKIVSEGPVNSVLSYDYQNWEASGNKYQVHETTSIWPGMYAYKNTVSISGLKGNETFLVALSNINNQRSVGVVDAGDFVCLFLHDRLTYNREWILGSAILVPKIGYQGYLEAPKKGQLTDSYLAELPLENNKEISYYAVAGWELSADKGFEDSNFFTKYVTNLAKELSVKIVVEAK